jgi:hypothetical protein
VVSAVGRFDPGQAAEDHALEESELLGRGPRTAIWVIVALVTALASLLRNCIE